MATNTRYVTSRIVTSRHITSRPPPPRPDRYDTVLMNPPFGTRRAGIDVIFLERALEVRLRNTWSTFYAIGFDPQYFKLLQYNINSERASYGMQRHS